MTVIAEHDVIADLSMYSTSQRETARRIARATAAFTSYPFRQSCVRILRIDPTDGRSHQGVAKPYAEFIKMLAGQIHSLEIPSMPSPALFLATDYKRFEQNQFLKELKEAVSEFPRLQRFQIALTSATWASLGDLLGSMPQLSVLEIASANNEWDDIPKLTLKPMKNLKELTLDDINDSDAPDSIRFLAILLGAAPNLESLRLKGVWVPRRTDPALRALTKLTKLRQLYLVSEHDIGIKRFRLAPEPLQITELVCDEDPMDEMFELEMDVSQPLSFSVPE